MVAAGGITPFQRFRLGASFATGPYLDASVPRSAKRNSVAHFTRALGVDLQLTLHHFELQSELMFTNFQVPRISQRLGAAGYFVELKHTLTPRWFLAGRWNQLYFDRLRSGITNGERPRFDSNRYSLEFGVGYHLSEKLLVKSSYQFNRTVTALEPRDDVVGIQLVYRFDPRNLLR